MFIQSRAGLRLCAASMCAAMLAACATYVPQPIDPAAQSFSFESRRLDSAEARQALEDGLGRKAEPWPPALWRFPDLSLVAARFNPDVAVAIAERHSAEAGLIVAGQRPNPGLSTIIQKNQDAVSGTSPWTYGFTLDVPVETAGKRDHRIQQSRQLINAAAWREADIRWQVRSRVRAAMLAAYPTEATVTRLQASQEAFVAAMEKRLAAGYIARPDLTQTQLALNQTRLLLTEARKQQDEGRVRLAASIGVSNVALDEVTVDFSEFETLPAIDALPAPEARRQALLNRPDVLAALANYEASQIALQLEIAKQYPDFSIGPGYTWDQGAAKWSLGLSLALPLLNQNQGGIALAQAKREEMAATFASVQAKAIGEVEQAMTVYRHALQTYGTAQDILRQQKATERTARAAFTAGQIDRIEWLSASYQATAADKSRIDALVQAQNALGKLEDALRRPLAHDTSRPLGRVQAQGE
ncbi:MAG: TolC family protein [Rhodocyclaceae bacterium]|nr:TolC family protein [Rhodocyclaceae bacterium]